MASFECNTLEVKDEGLFLSVSLNRPEVRNAFNAELISDLNRLAKWLERDSKYKAVFLRGRGKVFCAGGDLNWMGSSLEWDQKTNYDDSTKLSEMFTALNQLCIPLIGLIHGGAFGGGVGLVTVCDHVVCEEETQFSLSEVRLGLIPACIGPFVLDKIGAGHCRSLFISGERISAPKALVLGLVHQLVKGVEGLDEAKEKLKKTYSQCGPRAVQTAKKFLRELKGHSLAEQNELAAKTLADLRVGAEAQEGIRAFLEKRKPQW